MNLISDGNKSIDAEKYVRDLKDDYGSGVSTLCLVYNATGDTLYHVVDNDWMNSNIGRTPYPVKIGNGQWAAFLHVHKTSDATGSEAAVVYRGKNMYGNDRDFLLAWSTPFGIWYKNKAYCEEGGVDTFQRRWDNIYDNINNGDYSKTTDANGIHIQVDTASGGAPIFKAIIQIPFGP
uniref:23 kDa jasmonate-induced protein-like n=2 Tax=Chenopodium quinoa TaxID=63459 RepID=A0A803MD53_CHEQI